MTNFLFWTFVLLVAIPLLRVLQRPEKIYRYPYFMAAVFAIFILPQAISLVRFPGAASEIAVRNVLLVTCLCVAACQAGYLLPLRGCFTIQPRRSVRARGPQELAKFANSCRPGPPTGRISKHALRFKVVEQVAHPLDLRRLLTAGLVFVGSGVAFSFALSHMEIETNEFGGWTGLATIYGFFQQLCYPGFAICLTVALRRADLLSIGSTLVAAIVPIQSIIFGRREPAALFLLTIGLTLYFQWGLKPARWLIACSLIGALLVIPATATYRRFQLQNDWQSVRQMQLISNFKDFINEESVLELRNAAMLIEATRRSGDYEYGAGYWDHLVFRYIPGQLVGQAFKESVMIRHPREGLERELAAMDYANPPGSTVTAMGDSFQQFGFLGCVFFAGMGLFFRNLWRAATRRKTLFAQLLYMQSCTCAMRAVTHWTLDFLPGLGYNLIFLGAAALYARAAKSLRGPETRRPATAKSASRGRGPMGRAAPGGMKGSPVVRTPEIPPLLK